MDIVYCPNGLVSNVVNPIQAPSVQKERKETKAQAAFSHFSGAPGWKLRFSTPKLAVPLSWNFEQIVSPSDKSLVSKPVEMKHNFVFFIYI